MLFRSSRTRGDEVGRGAAPFEPVSAKTQPVSILWLPKFRILEFHRAETRPRNLCRRCELPDFLRKRPGSWPLTAGNGGTSASSRNPWRETSRCVEFEPISEPTSVGDLDIGRDADRTMIRPASNQQQDDPERTGFPPRTERYCHRSGRK